MKELNVFVRDNEYLCEIDISVEEWKEILQDNSVLSSNYKDTLLKFYLEPNHQSTCKILGEKYKTSPQSFNATITAFAKAVQKKLNRFEIKGLDGNPTYWIIPMRGKQLSGGLFEWTIREELVKAIEELGLQLKDSWIPKGNNAFFDIVEQASDIIKEQNLPFKIQKPADRFVWISDNQDCIGNLIAHYEIHKNRNLISVDLHFEDSETKNLFFSNIGQLPQRTKWIDWQNSKSLRYDQTFTLKEDDVAQKLVNALSELDQLVGDQVRNIVNNLNQFQLKTQVMEQYLQILSNKKQIILQGPPGTGKTYNAKNIAYNLIFNEIVSTDPTYRKKQLKRLEESDQFQLIQFHPSYTYEDFVRGIVATPNEDGGGVLYKTENRTLGKFAAKALVNYRNQDKDNETISKEVLLDQYFKEFVDSISDKLEESEGFLKLTETFGLIGCDEDAFRYRSENESWKNGNRMLFKDIIQAYNDGNKERKDLMKNNNLSGLAKQHASYFVRVLNLFQSYLKDNNLKFGEVVVTVEPLKPFVLIIDEINRANLPAVLGELIYALEYRGEALEGMYELESESGREVGKIIIPPNLYIIGTMNTADRSVGHIDYAIRRRFAFVDILPNTEPVSEFAKPLFKTVSELFVKNYEAINWDDPKLERSEYLASDFRPEDVWIGHSYFIANSPEEFALKLKYEVVPILKEYLKDGILLDTARGTIEKLLN